MGKRVFAQDIDITGDLRVVGGVDFSYSNYVQFNSALTAVTPVWGKLKYDGSGSERLMTYDNVDWRQYTTTIDFTSTAGTISITGTGPLNFEATGLPPNDDATALGSDSKRWANLYVGLAHGILWGDGTPFSYNVAKYSDGVGPWWSDRTSGHILQFNVQSLAATRTATWQNSSGTVAWLTDIPSALPPNGSAGGDLTGSYPNPTVAIHTRTSKTTPVGADEIILADSAASFASKRATITALQTTVGGIASLTTTGTSGAATFSGGTLNIPQYSGGGGSGTSMSQSITQGAHGFSVGQVIELAGTSYTTAIASSASSAEVVGMVSAVADSSHFTILFGGYITGLSGLTAGTTYFLSPTSAGALTATEPTTAGQVSKPVLIADTTTSGYFFNMRGMLISSTTIAASDLENTYCGAMM